MNEKESEFFKQVNKITDLKRSDTSSNLKDELFELHMLFMDNSVELDVNDKDKLLSTTMTADVLLFIYLYFNMKKLNSNPLNEVIMRKNNFYSNIDDNGVPLLKISENNLRILEDSNGKNLKYIDFANGKINNNVKSLSDIYISMKHYDRSNNDLSLMCFCDSSNIYDFYEQGRHALYWFVTNCLEQQVNRGEYLSIYDVSLLLRCSVEEINFILSELDKLEMSLEEKLNKKLYRGRKRKW